MNIKMTKAMAFPKYEILTSSVKVVSSVVLYITSDGRSHAHTHSILWTKVLTLAHCTQRSENMEFDYVFMLHLERQVSPKILF